MSYQQTYGAPSDRSYPPAQGGSDPYGPPSYQYPPPAGAQPYGPVPGSVGAYGPPRSSYGAPAPAYGAPPSAYGPPSGQAYAPPGAYPANPDEPRTLFISGFPEDVKERELNNLCRFLPGYQASQMHWKNGAAQGFALFSSNALARAAADALRSLCFDETSVLRCDMARKNMFLKDDATTPPVGAKRPRSDGQSKVYPETPDNPPCNTLFIGGLSPGVSEQELIEAFSKGPGFKQIKLSMGTKNMACFIEFEDIATATAMHAMNQGATLRSSDRGPIKVQFSKTPFGRKREGAYEAGAPQNNANPAAAIAKATALAASYVPPEYKPELNSM